jgi:hypothetical protein
MPTRSSPSIRTEASTLNPGGRTRVEERHGIRPAREPKASQPAAPLPAEHVSSGILLEEFAPPERPEYTLLRGALEAAPVLRCQAARLMELHPTGAGGHDSVHDEHMEVVVRVQRAPEPLRKGDRRELAAPGRRRARPSQRRPERANEDPKHGAGHLRVPVQERSQSLGQREHPLPDRKMREHMVREVRRDLGHPPGVARRAHPPPLARERQEALLPAVAASNSCEPKREDSAFEVAPGT